MRKAVKRFDTFGMLSRGVVELWNRGVVELFYVLMC